MSVRLTSWHTISRQFSIVIQMVQNLAPAYFWGGQGQSKVSVFCQFLEVPSLILSRLRRKQPKIENRNLNPQKFSQKTLKVFTKFGNHLIIQWLKNGFGMEKRHCFLIIRDFLIFCDLPPTLSPAKFQAFGIGGSLSPF